MLYAITYDISDSNQDHTKFFEKIKTLGGWMHFIEDTWVISTQAYTTAKRIFEELEPLIDKEEDYVLVVRIDSSDIQGWLPEEGWEWFQDNH